MLNFCHMKDPRQWSKFVGQVWFTGKQFDLKNTTDHGSDLHHVHNVCYIYLKWPTFAPSAEQSDALCTAPETQAIKQCYEPLHDSVCVCVCVCVR